MRNFFTKTKPNKKIFGEDQNKTRNEMIAEIQDQIYELGKKIFKKLLHNFLIKNLIISLTYKWLN
jgi:hypothetical protein